MGFFACVPCRESYTTAKLGARAGNGPIGRRSVMGGSVSKRSVTGPFRNVAQKSRAPAMSPSMTLKANNWP